MPQRYLLHIVRLGLILGWAYLIGYDLRGSLPNHGLQLTSIERRRLVVILPQAWAFFTRDPHDPEVRYYVRVDGRWELANLPHASAKYWFGVDKIPRVRGMELGALQGQVPKNQWRRCTTSLADCSGRAELVRVPVVNRALNAKFCGDVLVERQPPLPWAWASFRGKVYMPSNVVVMAVRCRSDTRSATRATFKDSQ